MSKEHKHEWKLTKTDWVYTAPANGTYNESTEHAYLPCQCGQVRKVRVEAV